ncbi:MAG: DnaD domain protein [Clostridiales bacterium]|nr:DnaD domain protein [Clostridiales bacterium]
MSVKINLGEWGGVFAVPNAVADKYLKLAGVLQLKVLLCLLRHNSRELTIAELCEMVNCEKEDAKDAIGFWIAAGLLKNTESGLLPGDSSPDYENNKNEFINPTQSREEKPSRTVTRVQRPEPFYVAQRIAEDPDIAVLMQEAEMILSRPLSHGDSSTLVLLHDTDGLTTPVILMILQYVVSLGKGMRYVEAVGADWASEGINTIELAEKKLMQLTQAKEAWKLIQTTFGLEAHSPTQKEKSNAIRWVCEMKYDRDVLRYAYELCVDAKGKYLPNYVSKVLESWYSKGIRTLSEAKADSDSSKRSERASGTQGIGGKPSYDLDEFEKSNIFDEN